MRPGARLAAAIEILTQVECGETAPDRVVDGYFRARRYAGKQDRAAIAALVWGVLREGRTLAWRLGIEGPSIRLKALAALRRVEALTPDQVAARCTGQGYDPAPPTTEEQAALAVMDRGEVEPDWVALCCPPELEPALRRRFGVRFTPAMAALQARASLDLRVNTLKTDRDRLLADLADQGIGAEPCLWSPLGLRVPGREWLGRNRVFTEGLAAVQDEGSQIVALLCAARPGDTVVDFCAGAGGKTLALAAAMERRGRLMACDISAGRLERMGPRLDRAGGAGFVERRVIDDDLLAQDAEQFDCVLVDAPCSLTGTWRRHPDVRWRTTTQVVSDLVRLQREILDRAATLVKPGGRLVYATCSLLPEEDEDVVASFLANRLDFALPDQAALFTEATGATLPTGEGEGASQGIVLDPLTHGTDGFFAATMIRGETLP